VYGEANNSAAFGVFSSGDFGGTGAKYFIQPHPTDATNQINFACLEGNESGTYFRGSIRVQGGVATVVVPESFRLVTDADSVTATATAVGAPALVWIQSQTLEQIVVRANADVTVNYLVPAHGAGSAAWRRSARTRPSFPSTAGCRSDCSTAPTTASCAERPAQSRFHAERGDRAPPRPAAAGSVGRRARGADRARVAARGTRDRAGGLGSPVGAVITPRA
jgi:hypothetical protein